MEKTRILIVEDERIVAKHIENMLAGLGYDVAGVAAAGADAVRMSGEKSPDLVLMDIMLGGGMDGITASEQIWEHSNIPVVYLTAYADEATLQRAKVTEPFGYLLKPFEEKELYTVIEMALYKYKMGMRLKERERWLSTILTSIGDGVISTDKKEKITFMNSVAESLTGQKKDACLGKSLPEILHIIGEKTNRKITVSIHKIAKKRALAAQNQTLYLVRRNTRIPVEIGATVIKDEKDEIDGTVLVFRDITQRKLQEQRLAFLAIHDPLTELPNRTLFTDRLTHALANALRREHRVAVMMLDLDGFKKINDTMGHAVGDRLLKSVGERLHRLLRKSDTIARLGGDEFMILLPEIPDFDFATLVAKRIQRAFKKIFDLKDHSLFITASIGIAVYPEDGKDGETLTRNADIAMYESKEAGRNAIRYYSRIEASRNNYPKGRTR